MKRSNFYVASILFVFSFFVMTGIAAAADEITAEQFKGLIVLLNNLDHGKTTLIAVQGDKTIEITDFALMKKISLSGVKTTFYLKDSKTGVKRLVVSYEAGETSKSLSRDFWKLICRSSGLCGSCAELFGENLCK
jgi:hypothetical protein